MRVNDLARPLHLTSTRSALMISALSLSLSALSVGCQSSQPSTSGPSNAQDSSTTRGTTAPQAQLGQLEQEVIYGEDTRVDVFAAPPALATLARRSIFAMIPADRVDERDPNAVRLRASTLQQSFGVCQNQRFSDQITAASCSATLIDDDLLVTAGHCLGSQGECESQRFVLGYLMESNGLATITSEDVFSCQELVATYDDGQVDYAFVRLDRAPDPSRAAPAPVRRLATPLPQNEPLVLMGFPSGLPLKVDDGGFVSDPRTSTNDFFRGTIDSFGGNSGSGVFNDLGQQVGILVRGEQDYVRNGRCMVVNELSIDRGPGDSAEEITYLHQALSALCATGYDSERLCAPPEPDGGLCSSCGPTSSCQAGLTCASFSTIMSEQTFCAPTCLTSTPCPSGHVCRGGQCEPELSRFCGDSNEILASDSCGRFVGVLETCTDTQYCRRGECLARGAGDRCEAPTELEAVSQTLRATLTEGYEATSRGSCAGLGPERFYHFTLEQPNHLIARASSDDRRVDTVLYLRSACDESAELACDDDGNPTSRLGSLLDLDLPPGEYYLALDTFSPDVAGDVTLELTFCDEGCELGEQRCSADGLVSVCEQPEGASCRGWSQPFECPNGQTCSANQCTSPGEGDRCESALTLRGPYPQVVSGEFTEDSTLATRSICALDDELIADMIYEFTLPYASRVSVETASATLRELSLWTGCAEPGTERFCTPISLRPPVFTGFELNLAPGDYHLIALAQALGPFEFEFNVEPVCVDTCLEGALRCDEAGEQVERCERGAEGCLSWQVVELCGDSFGCAGGECVELCRHECEPGEQRCFGLEEREACGEDERGCRTWVSIEPCVAPEVCALNGQCVLEESDWGVAGTEAGVEAGVQLTPDQGVVGGDDLPPPNPWVGTTQPRELELEVRERGGCDQSPLTPTKRSPLELLIVVGALVFMRRPSNISLTSPKD